MSARQLLDRHGRLIVTVPETVEATAEDLGPGAPRRLLPEQILIAEVQDQPISTGILGAQSPWRSETDTRGLASHYEKTSHPHGRC